MGTHWVPVREAVTHGTLRPTDAGTGDVAGRFDALLRFASLQLGKRLGEGVSQVLTRRDLADPSLRTLLLTGSLCDTGTMTGGLRIHNAIAPLMITADLRAGQITCYIDIDAPKEGRPTTRVNWLLRQLKDAPDNLRIESTVARGGSAAELLTTVRDNPDRLVLDPNKDIRTFRIAMIVPMGAKRGRGKGAFIDSVIDEINAFYTDVVQHLKGWTPAAPKMRELPAVDQASDETALSSQDGPVPNEPGTIIIRTIAWSDTLACNRLTIKEIEVPADEAHLYTD